MGADAAVEITAEFALDVCRHRRIVRVALAVVGEPGLEVRLDGALKHALARAAPAVRWRTTPSTSPRAMENETSCTAVRVPRRPGKSIRNPLTASRAGAMFATLTCTRGRPPARV